MLGVTIVAIGGRAQPAGRSWRVMLVSGGAWIAFISLANALVQQLAPDWVRARVHGGLPAGHSGRSGGGQRVWGMLGSRASVDAALLWAGLGTIATTALGLLARLPDVAADVSPWNHWRAPVHRRGRRARTSTRVRCS